MKLIIGVLLVVVASVQGLISEAQLLSTEGAGFYEGPGVLPSQILRARGYLAKDFYVRSSDGYILRVTRGTNPLINNGTSGAPGRVPIMFVHGILESFNVFVINSFGASPSDFSNVSLARMSQAQVNARFGGVASAKALPLIALDCGHTVWIVSRRGFPGSQKLTGDPLQGEEDPGSPATVHGPYSAFFNSLTSSPSLEEITFSFDKRFWNFSLDEQAAYDLPMVVDLVRNQTGYDKIAVVAHSAGGTITLQSLSLYSQLNDKLSAVILWSEGFSLGHADVFTLTPEFLPLLQAYVGSLPPAFSTDQIEAFLGLFCTTALTQSTLCETFADFILGASAGQEPILPEFINSLLYPSSSHELAQNVQSLTSGGQTHYYSNELVATRPYNLSAITNRNMSFYVGATDFTVSALDVQATLPLLSVPYQFHLINTTFNHQGYFYHNNNSVLAILPSLREIQIYTQS